MGIIGIIAKRVIKNGNTNPSPSRGSFTTKENLPRKFDYRIPAKGGRRKDLPKPVRSKMEANIWRWYIWSSKKHGKITVEYEPEVFQLHDPTSNGVIWYIPDFKISYDSGSHYIEVKGLMDSQAIKKATLLQQNYRGIKLYFITPEKYKLIEHYYSRFIDNWE